jgi:hypothetical protein
MSDDRDDDVTPQRRPRSHWGDEQRAAVGRGRRTPPQGVAIPQDIGEERTAPAGLPLPAERDEFTPVGHILDTITDPQMKRVVRLIWEHSANIEMRSEQRVGSDALRTELDTVQASVKKLFDRAWWLFTMLVGALGAAAIKLVIIGRAYGDMETEIRALKDRTQLIESVDFLRNRLPAFMPEKDP